MKIYTEILDTRVDILPNTNYRKKPLDEFNHFIECIKTGQDPIAAPEEAVELMKIIDGVYASSEKNMEIVINS